LGKGRKLLANIATENPSDKDSMILKVEMDGSIKDYKIVPVRITSSKAPYQPYPASDAEAKQILQKIKRYSRF
jgi:hypothetical protein